MVICHPYWKTIPKNVGKTMVCHQPVIIFIPLLRLSPIKLVRKNDSWPPHWDGHSDLFKAIFHEKSTCSWEELWKKWEKLWKKWEDLWKKWEELWKKWENYGKSGKIMEKVGQTMEKVGKTMDQVGFSPDLPSVFSTVLTTHQGWWTAASPATAMALRRWARWERSRQQ